MHPVIRLTLAAALLIAALGLAVLPPTPAAAREDSGQCARLFQQALIDMMAHCFNAPAGTVCGASGSVEIRMASGQVVSGAGSTARINGVTTLQLTSGDDGAWPLASLQLTDPRDAGKSTALVVMGPATLAFESAPGLPAGAAFRLDASGAPQCPDLPYPGVVVQSPEKTLTLLHINDTDIAVNGMAVIGTRNGGTLVINALTKETILGQTGTVLFAGYSAYALGDFAGDVTPFDAARVAHLPIEILPQMIPVALPGDALVLQEMNLFREPLQETYTNVLAQPGLPVSVFGQDPSGVWVYARTYDGISGWMPAYALQVRVPGALPVLEATPASLIRPFGSIQGYLKTSAEHNNLRAGPGENYEIVLTVPLWTDLALYGRSPDSAWLLVETVDGVRAWINGNLISTATPVNLDELPFAPESELPGV